MQALIPICNRSRSIGALIGSRFDGKMSPPVKRLCFERGDSVAAILFNAERRKLLLVKQFKYPTCEKGSGWIVETVAGILEPGETPEAALRRETLEETGYEIALLEPIATFYVSPGGSSERILLELDAWDKKNMVACRASPGNSVRRYTMFPIV